MTYKLLAQTMVREPIPVDPSGYYYYGEGSEGASLPPANEIRLDTGFNQGANDDVRAVALQPDGKIIIGGDFTQVGGVTRNRVARLNSDGSLDTGFNPNVNNWVWALALQPDGKIIIGGDFTQVGGVTRNNIARLNSDGSLDTGFNQGANNYVYSLALQPDGKILVGGLFTTVGIGDFATTRNRIARLNSDGSLDTGFNPNASGSARALALQPDGKILVGGSFTQVGGLSRNYIARLDSDGSVDTGFDPNANDWVRALALQTDGKILVGGEFTQVGGLSRNRIARLNSDGSVDTGFNPDASVSLTLSPSILSMAIQTDGKILVGGSFAKVNDVESKGLARLNTDGTVDKSFDFGTYTDNQPVLALYVQPDGKIIVGGSFSNFGGVGINNIARLKKNFVGSEYEQVYLSFSDVIVESVFVVNQNNFSNSIDIIVLPDNDEIIEKRHHVVWDHFIDENDYVVFKLSVPMSPGDRLLAYSTVGEPMSVNAFGKELG